MLRIRQSLAGLRAGADLWSDAGDARAHLEPLQTVGRTLGVARLIVSTDDGDAPLDVWCGPVSARARRPIPVEAQPAAVSQHIYCRCGILALPLRQSQHVFGVLTLVARSDREIWSGEQIQGGTELAHCLAEVWARFEARRMALAQADFSRAVLASVPGDVAVLDATGRLVATNDSWDAAAASLNPIVKGASGTLLLDATTLADGPRARLATAIEAVLRDGRPQPVWEFSWEEPAGRRWGEVRVQPLRRPAGGAVLTHQDVTVQMRVEAETRHHLDEVAHVHTVSGVGALAAAVAHELNQPLTAVLSNAHAARRILAGASPCIADLREILDDIIEQDKRAGEIIHRVRGLLSHGQVDPLPVDLNVLVRDVIRLLNHEAALGGVTIASSLDPDLPCVRGDRLQLQHVVLTLLLNAIHAAASRATTLSSVTIATGQCGTAVRLVVTDSGPGLRRASPSHLLDPCCNTRPDGIGGGLFLSRSIVEVHGGGLSARNRAAGGAEFVVTLPAEGNET
jgi:C4-dicarboxylate-specific signal transduction histidine kinase